MSASTFIKRFIFSIPADRVFTTRELLHFGKRNAVDLCLFKLVNKEVIFRLARGVFIRTSNTQKYPSLSKLAFIKASSFGKTISIAGINAAINSNLTEQNPNNYFLYFYTSGCTSSFKAGKYTIRFIAASSRKRFLKNDKIGNFLKGFWYLGKGSVQEPLVQLMNVSRGLIRPERLLLKKMIRIMPIWMGKELTHHHSRDQ